MIEHYKSKCIMNILIVSDRDDNYRYEMAARLYEKFGDKVFNDIFEQL